MINKLASSAGHKSDQEIISLLAAGTYKGWEYLYDKYAPLMYGTIMKAVGYKKSIANEMLIQSFVGLKQIRLSAPSPIKSLALFLVQHCYEVIKNRQTTAAQKLQAPPYAGEPFPMLKEAISDKQPLKIIAAKVGVPEANAMETLRSELKKARAKFSLVDN